MRLGNYWDKRFVYFARPRDDKSRIKIGCTSFPKQRMRALRTECLLLIECPEMNGYELERWLHVKFADARLEGEWFEPSPRLLALLAETRSTRVWPYIHGRLAAIG
jgi:hypothetical protein